MSEDRVALIVGGGTGIGLATAEQLVRNGVAVALAGRRHEVLAAAAEKLRAVSPAVAVAHVAGDAAVEAEAGRIVSSTVAQLGRLDYCVNCAGIYEPAHILDMDTTAWRNTLSTTLDAVLYPSVAAAREMVTQGRGRFVLVSSINAPLSEPESAHYSAAKAGVSSLARSLAVDLAQHNIQANAIAPGWVRTAMVDEFVQNATPEALARLNINGRVGEPEEIANVIAYLLLEAPDDLNGATIFVDGGQTAMAPLI
ncbi:MAG: SDR family NAD(P)-dependent oxidoreductase [Solirubrobacteraceae bacterium]